MSAHRLARSGAGFAVAGLLATLAAAAPAVNAKGGPPRSVFLTLPAEIREPEVALSVTPRPDGRWRIRIDTEGFTFSNLCLSEAEAIPVGHAHVIVDGVKVASAYDPIVEVGPFPAGLHDLTVVLRGQDHRALLGRHGLIKTEAVLEVTEGNVAG